MKIIDGVGLILRREEKIRGNLGTYFKISI